ncbi:OLC1v1010029C1 [Oldenlandia corymbosa var. corymbosa]|uniref:OLC1v1010029C1 n=1 Tax=Oldenlandia corymbosa var. corymbosa TaxID=529605 RepID=A0AAV1DQB8_OLDCO|nr:OLC1v1010029C1 [Oldenlandia corymbosa var. corymbosa]
MQSSLLYSVSSNSANFHLLWASSPYKFPSPKPAKLVCPKTLLKPLSVSNSVRTSFNFQKDFDFEGENQNLKFEEPDKGQPGNSYHLPIVIRESGTVLRYSWDGRSLKLVSLDGKSFSLWDFVVDFEDAARKLVRICGSALRDFFLPREVSENYKQYVKWKFLHRVFSSALQVLATQAMFRAIGIGYKRSLPSAAALNWVLKDGLGRLSRCIYTASLASAFDTNLKRVRFSTSVLFSLSIGVELLTPVFPNYFLLLATVANIAKQISLACYLATGTTVHRSFAIADNLGEVSAKSQIQTVCFDNLGLLLAALLNIALRNNQRLQAALPFVVYPIFSAIDLFGIYQGLKHVHLQTLTKDRLEIIINAWFQQGYVPSPAEVSKDEGIDFFWTKGRELWPIRIGCLNLRGQLPELASLTMQALTNEDFYFLCMENFNNGMTRIGQEKPMHGIVLCVREGASALDVMMGLLQVKRISLPFSC